MAAPKEFKSSSSISLESVKIIAESIGVSNISDDAAKLIADDITYRMKMIIQVIISTCLISIL